MPMYASRSRSVPAPFLLPAALAALAACSSPRAWVYAPEPRSERGPVVDATLVVPPFLDRRTNDNTDARQLYLVPLMPFGYQDLSVPEGTSSHVWSGLWQFKPTDDLARAVAQEIDAARVFREAFTDPRNSTGDYVLTGEIRTLAYDGKMLTYGLSLYGPLVWFVGLPASHVHNALEVHLVLRRQGDARVLWDHTVRGAESETSWIYGGGTDFYFDRLLKAAMPAALASLEQALAAGGAAAAVDRSRR